MTNKNMLLMGTASLLSLHAAAQNDQKPNIVLIMVDDMGYSDLGCYGGEIPTPNLDNLAKKGVRFTHFCNTGRSCPSRAMFPPAEVLKHVDVSDYKDMDEARKLIFDLIVQYRRMKNTGVVAVYQKDRFDEYSNFARIGDGSLGGKGRGLAFIGAMVK